MFNRIKYIIAKRIFAKIAKPRMIYGIYLNNKYLGRTRISNTAYIYHEEKLSIEDNVFIFHYTILDATGGITIGEGTQIGAWCGIFTHSSHLAIRYYGDDYDKTPEAEKEHYPVEPVKIGKFVFIGAQAIIMPGVEIGDGSIISPGAIVRKSVPAYSLVMGEQGRIMGDTRKMDMETFKSLPSSYYLNYLKRMDDMSALIEKK